MNKRPIYLTGELFDEKEQDIFWDDILGSLSSVLKQIAGSFKLANKGSNGQLSQLTVRSSTIQNLCYILVGREFKSKTSQKKIKSILNNVSVISGEGQAMVEELFRGSLKMSLKRFIAIIEETKVDIDELKKEVTIINQILKFSKSSANGKSETNICDENLFFNVVKAVSVFIDRKHTEHASYSL